MDSALINSIINKPSINNDLLNRQNSYSQTSTDIDTNSRCFNRFGSNRTMTDLVIKPTLKNLSDPRILDSSLLTEGFYNDLYGNMNTEDYDPIEIEKNIRSLIYSINTQLEANVNTDIFTTYKKDKPVVVKVYLIFLKISEIDTIKERFRAEAFIESHWIDNDVDPNVEFDPAFFWNPELKIENGIGDVKQEIRYKLSKTPDNDTEIHEMRMVKGVFWESMLNFSLFSHYKLTI
jgi:hypothetical protein